MGNHPSTKDMKTTRDNDLEVLDQSRLSVESESGLIHRSALLDNVYEQSKDPTLERMRQQLAYWITKGLSFAPDDLEGIPTAKQQLGMAECELHIQELEKQIKAYSSSPDFQQRLLRKIAKHSDVEAQVFIKKGN